MEGGLSRSDIVVRKRRSETRKNNGSDSLPRKFKPPPGKGTSPCLSEFEMEHQVHDVEEHFRRSLQSFHNKMCSPVMTPQLNIGDKNNDIINENEQHQIVVAENTPHVNNREMSTPPSSTTPNTTPHYIINSTPNVLTRVSSSDQTVVTTNITQQLPQVFVNLPSASTNGISSVSTSLLTANRTDTNKSVNEALPMTATQQFLSATLGQQAGLVFPGVTPTLSAPQSNVIPVLDGNGIPQFIATSSSNPQQGVSPVFFLGPGGGIPVLPQPGVVFVNPTDLSSLQQTSSMNTTQNIPSTQLAQPSYIIVPPSFQAPFGLTPEQISALTASIQQQQNQQQQQQHNQQQQKQQVEDTNKQSNVGTPSRSAELKRDTVGRVHSRHITDGDSVEEHFARALGEQWRQVKKGIGHSPHDNKIPV